MPLFSSYLVRVYAWRLILDDRAALGWSLGQARAAARCTSASGDTRVVDRVRYHGCRSGPARLRPRSADPGGRCSRRPATWGAGARRRSGASCCPLALPGSSRLDLHVLADARRLPQADPWSANAAVHRQRDLLATSATPGNLPARRCLATVPIAIMAVYLLVARRSARPRASRRAAGRTDRTSRLGRARDALPVHPHRASSSSTRSTPRCCQSRGRSRGSRLRSFARSSHDSEIRAAFVALDQGGASLVR